MQNNFLTPSRDLHILDLKSLMKGFEIQFKQKMLIALLTVDQVLADSVDLKPASWKFNQF